MPSIGQRRCAGAQLASYWEENDGSRSSLEEEVLSKLSRTGKTRTRSSAERPL